MMGSKTRHNYVLPISAKRQTQTQIEGVEHNTLSKRHPEKSGYSFACIRQNICQHKNGNDRQRWTFYNNKGNT